MSREEEILDALYDHTLDGEAEPVIELTNEALELGMDPLTILFDSLIPSLEEVGRLFEEGEYFVPEMLVAARAMAGAMNILKPLIAESGAKPIGTFVMGTVKGDIHDIGKMLAKKVSAVGFKVLAHDPFVGAEGSEVDGMTFVSLETILRESDFVSLHTPLTKDTAEMIGKKQLDQMKDSAFLVNVSRGALVDEAALINALEENRIAGAGLDVLVEESADPVNPLQKMEQVIVTSHTAFYSEEAIQDLQRKAAQKVVAALSGQIPEPLVNPEVLKVIQK